MKTRIYATPAVEGLVKLITLIHCRQVSSCCRLALQSATEPITSVAKSVNDMNELTAHPAVAWPLMK